MISGEREGETVGNKGPEEDGIAEMEARSAVREDETEEVEHGEMEFDKSEDEIVKGNSGELEPDGNFILQS
jgi:hypothetical protein